MGLTTALGFLTPGLAKERDMPAGACVHSGVVDCSHLAALHVLKRQTTAHQLAAAQADMRGNSIHHKVFPALPNSHSQVT